MTEPLKCVAVKGLSNTRSLEDVNGLAVVNFQTRSDQTPSRSLSVNTETPMIRARWVGRTVGLRWRVGESFRTEFGRTTSVPFVTALSTVRFSGRPPTG
jgi:hypothetical protein